MTVVGNLVKDIKEFQLVEGKLPKFNSITDAEVWYLNSGYLNWEWFKGFSEDKLVDFVYKNAEKYKSEDDMIKAFLKNNKQNPKDYF